MKAVFKQGVLERVGVEEAELDEARHRSLRIAELCRDLEAVGNALREGSHHQSPEKPADLELIRLERELVEDIREALTQLGT